MSLCASECEQYDQLELILLTLHTDGHLVP